MSADAPALLADEASAIASLVQASLGGAAVALPPTFSERCSLERAYALQALHQRRVLQRIGGWAIGLKLGGTNPTMMQALQLDSPFMGPILSARHYTTSARVPRALFRVCIIEAEIAVRIGCDMAPRTSVPSIDELMDVIDAMYPSIEIADSRLQNPAAARACDIIADLGYAGAWIQGAACKTWRTLDLEAVQVSVSCQGETRHGSSVQVLGHPLHALGLAIAALGRRGLGLTAGMIVTTGTCTQPWPHVGSGHVAADFGKLGHVGLDLI